jgi:predicted RNA-binding Zn-ribbon protein involved in translation (DUF1610 family)
MDPQKEKEAMRQMFLALLEEFVLAPWHDEIMKRLKDIDESWNDVRAKVEPLLQGRYATCPECGAHALSGAFCDGEKFPCPECGAELVWALAPRRTTTQPEHNKILVKEP